MILLLGAFVCIGLFAAMPVFAIPSPDFLGPLISSIVAMLGIASAFFGAMSVWAARMMRRYTSRDRKTIWLILGIGFLLIVGLIGGIAFLRFREERQAFQAQTAEHRLEAEQEAATSTAPPLARIPTSTLPLTTSWLSTDLLSSRVTSTLVSTDILHDVVRQPSWSDRILVLDIREEEERNVGQVDATTTWIRYGDLINGGAATLPHDRDILVICWTSLRGNEIATWLRTHGFPRAFAIKGGLQGDGDQPLQNGWIAAKLPFRGEALWSKVYGLTTTIKVDGAKTLFDAHPTVIDITSAKHYATGHLPGALRLEFEKAPTSEVNRVIGDVPSSANVLIVCNGYVNCFYGKILAIRLNRLGRHADQPYDDNAYDWLKKGFPLVR